MTREEGLSKAINIVRYFEAHFAKSKEAREDALKIVEVLEQEPCEDCVSRKELLKIYEDRFWELQKIKHLKDNKGAENRQMGVNYCINILKEIPPIIPAEKVGRWITLKDEYGDVCEAVCSNCDSNGNHKWAYCPKCGAKMQEVGE